MASKKSYLFIMFMVMLSLLSAKSFSFEVNGDIYSQTTGSGNFFFNESQINYPNFSYICNLDSNSLFDINQVRTFNNNLEATECSIVTDGNTNTCPVLYIPTKEKYIIRTIVQKVTNTFPYEINPLKYRSDYVNYITEDVCRVSVESSESDLENGVLKVTPNFDLSYYKLKNVLNNVPEDADVLKKNLYMKAIVKAEVLKVDDNGNTINLGTYYPTNIESREVDGIFLENFNYLKPGENTFAFSFLNEQNLYEREGEGTYKVIYSVEPVDLKCDFNENDNLEDDEREIISLSKYIEVDGLKEENGLLVLYNNLYDRIIALDPSTYELIFRTHKIDLNKFNYQSFKRLDNKKRLELSKTIQSVKKVVSGEELETSLNESLNKTDEVNVTVTKVSDNQIKVDVTNKEKVDENTTFYAYLPKGVDVNKVEVTSDKPIKVFWVDLDPIIGWQFEDEPGEVTINGTDDATVVVVDDPIVYNKGNIIINYRENSCNAGELELTDVEDIAGGRIDNSYNWKICLNTLENTTLQKGTSGNYITLFYINNNYYNETTGSELNLASTNTDYWFRYKIQEENPGEYSCLGSFDPSSGEFGDCGFTTHRIWIRLDKDTSPPEVNVKYPKLSHNLRVELESADDLSGVDSVKYCVDDFGTCTPNIEYSSPFYVTCNNQDGCMKKLVIRATDKAGNLYKKVEDLIVAEAGSVCQPDCTLYPKPGRVVSQCDGIAGCHFYNEQAKKACHMKKKDSWVRFDFFVKTGYELNI